ncbi:MAG: hypothetical protein J7L25_06020 [Deltaproteobacteria bacterium]|nr:hypothetical protein [Candidatus Tharpella aukensis]
MSQYQQTAWQDIVVWLILGLVILALLYYIGRRLQILKNVTHKSTGKNLGNCTSCQNCPHSEQSCAKAENRKESEN